MELEIYIVQSNENDKSKISAKFFTTRKGCQKFHLQIFSNIVATDCGLRCCIMESIIWIWFAWKKEDNSFVYL